MLVLFGVEERLVIRFDAKNVSERVGARLVKHALAFGFALACTVAIAEVQWYPQQVRFSPDDSHLLINVCEVGNSNYCRIRRYWLAEGKWDVLSLDEERSYLWPDYSPDGKRIVLSSMSCPQRKCDLRNARLALMNADGTDFRAIPGSDTPKTRPSFSPDGRRVIYWQIDEIFKTSRQYVGFWHVYETELDTGTGRKLTRFYATRVLTGPKYWPDGKRFMFSAMDFYWFPDNWNDPTVPAAERAAALQRGPKETGHMVYVLEPGSEHLKPLFNSPRNWSVAHDVSHDGKRLLYASSAATSAYGSLYTRDPVALSEPKLLLKEYGAGSEIMDAALSKSRARAVAIRNLATDLGGGGSITNAKFVELWLMGTDGSDPIKVGVGSTTGY